MTYFDVPTIISYHRRLIEEFGGQYGVRDEKLLNAALAAPFHTFGGVDLYPTVTEKAARLAYGLIKNHPFVDGNKRVAALALKAFLELNGVQINDSPEDLAVCMYSVAAGEASEDDLIQWLRERERT